MNNFLNSEQLNGIKKRIEARHRESEYFEFWPSEQTEEWIKNLEKQGARDRHGVDNYRIIDSNGKAVSQGSEDGKKSKELPSYDAFIKTVTGIEWHEISCLETALEEKGYTLERLRYGVIIEKTVYEDLNDLLVAYEAVAVSLEKSVPLLPNYDHRVFHSYQHWVCKGHGWIDENDVCVDANGKRLLIGKDFMAAEYPVRFFSDMRRISDPPLQIYDMNPILDSFSLGLS